MRQAWLAVVVAIILAGILVTALGCGGETTVTQTQTVTTTAAGAGATVTVTQAGSGATVTQTVDKTVTVTGAATPTATFKAKKLKFGNMFAPPTTNVGSYIAKVWMDTVTERTGGAITFDVSWGSALGAPAEYIDLLQRGTLDVIQTYGWYTPSRLPLENYDYTIPFGTVDYPTATKVREQILKEFPQFDADLAKNNAVRVYTTAGGTYAFASKQPIRHVSDMKGQKCMSIGRYFGMWLEPTGAASLVTVGQEMYQMFQTGVATMNMVPEDLMYSMKFIEQAPNIMECDLFTGVWYLVVMNKNTLESLEPGVQKIILDVGKEINTKAATEILPQWMNDYYAKFWKAGVQYTKLPQSEVQEWVKAIPDVPKQWADETEKLGYPAHDIIKRHQQIAEELGFKWMRYWDGYTGK